MPIACGDDLRAVTRRLPTSTSAACRCALPHRGLPDGDVDLSIRPEAITLASEGASRLRGTIRKASYLGGTMEYSVETAVGTLFVISTAVDAPMPVGARVGIVLARHGVVAIAAAAS